MFEVQLRRSRKTKKNKSFQRREDKKMSNTEEIVVAASSANNTKQQPTMTTKPKSRSRRLHAPLRWVSFLFINGSSGSGRNMTKARKKKNLASVTPINIINDLESKFESIGGVYYSSPNAYYNSNIQDGTESIFRNNNNNGSNRERFGTTETTDTIPTLESTDSDDSDVSSTIEEINIDGSDKQQQKQKNHFHSKWVTSGRPGHHNNAPLIVRRPPRSSPIATTTTTNATTNLDDAEELGMIIQRSKQRLPLLSRKYVLQSNHVMINSERVQRIIQPLMRIKQLDELATQHAKEMAQRGELYYMNLKVLHNTIVKDNNSDNDENNNSSKNNDIAINRLGLNVVCGESILSIHKQMMTISKADCNNVLDRRFTCMGMGTAKNCDNGKLYLCQIFRG